MDNNDNMNTKLVGLLKEHNVRISKTNGICLDDLVKNIIQSKHPDAYMKKISDKVAVGKKYYVSIESGHSIITHGKSKISKNILEKLEKDENDNY